MRWRLGDAFKSVSLIVAGTETGDERKRALPVADAAMVVRLMLSPIGTPRLSRRDLEEILAACNARSVGGVHGEPPSYDAVMEAIERGLARRRLIVVTEERRRVIRQVDGLPEALGPEGAPDSWIEVVLVDEDGEAIADEPYKIEDASGKVWRGTTNVSGKVRLEGIDPGSCKVSFPFLPPEWKKAS